MPGKGGKPMLIFHRSVGGANDRQGFIRSDTYGNHVLFYLAPETSPSVETLRHDIRQAVSGNELNGEVDGNGGGFRGKNASLLRSAR